MLAWAWRIGAHRGIGSPWVRVMALLAATPVLAAAVTATISPLAAPNALPHLGWPTAAGPGGAVGQVLAALALDAGSGLLGVLGGLLVWAVGAALAAVLVLMALGLSHAEWRAAARISTAAGRGTVLASARATRSLSGRLGGLWPRRPSPSSPTASNQPAFRRVPPMPPDPDPEDEAGRPLAPPAIRRHPAAAREGDAAGRPAPGTEAGPATAGRPGLEFSAGLAAEAAAAASGDRADRGCAAGQRPAARIRAFRLRRAGQHRRDPPGSRGDALRARARPRHPQRARHRPRRRRGAQPLRHRGANRDRAGPQRHRHRGAQQQARDGLSRRAVRRRGRAEASRPAGAGARQGYRRRTGRGRPRAHAAPDDRRHHRLGQVGRDQCDDPEPALSAAARSVPADPDRPEDARTIGLRGHSAPDGAGRHRARARR